ncbi:hypothetical protein M6B22_16905 [Jatrophihabitans cynanchi]|uniref:DNA-binding protein n=1 Tax=Jatrophihabitans cynanchi TaxID=2944128 RepID=A0ABY7JUI4_9ACTN|nr:hypothetical protein [Jatrophihabitans sp. SB3-54]WAX56202.1 hypothetical protein M6B22_16905 [Jatrophihabitans sp. SB3-54]
MQSLITMSEIARLANVTRQAVTNWRRRPASSRFPPSVKVVAGVEYFDQDEILDWLDETGRGNNREARLDAPAVAAPENLDLDRAVALLALRAKVAQDLGPLTAGERIALAEQVDPHDRYLVAEIRDAADDGDLAVYVDELVAATRGPGEALSRLLDSRPARGARGFAPDLVALLQSIATACRTYLGPDDVAIDLRLDPRARQIAAGFESAAHTDNADRSMLRHLVIDGLTLDDVDRPRVRVVSLPERDDSEALRLADDAALELAAGQVAVIVGPASALCDRLAGDLYDGRRKTIEMGAQGGCALIAAFKLPRGLWREAHRQNLGLWVLRGDVAATGVLVADLSGRAVDNAELADDVLGALEQTGARSYRYGRVVSYNETWTRDTVVVPGIGAASPISPKARSPLDRVVEATLVTREPVNVLDLPVSGRRMTTRPAPRSLGELVDARSIKIQNGSRVADEHCDATGSVRILSADPSAPARSIDPLVAVDRYSHANRTEPGDVVFLASPPRAVVDEEGGSLVASPSRILRVDALRAGIGPRALAAAINEMTSSEWRTWLIPELPRADIQPLEDALGEIRAHLAELRRREEAATNIITNLIQGVAEGSVALGSSTTERKAG